MEIFKQWYFHKAVADRKVVICASQATTAMLAASQLLMPVAIAVPGVTKPTVTAASIFVMIHVATRKGSLILFQLCPNHSPAFVSHP